MDVLVGMQPVLLLLLGFLFGIAGPIIHERNKRSLARDEFWRAMQIELRELRYRCAVAAYGVYQALGKLDREFFCSGYIRS